MKNLTNKEFIDKAKRVHGEKYDYSLTQYVNSRSKIKIGCLKHGVFEQKANNHLNGYGCPKCNGKRINDTERFIFVAKSKHAGKYDYSLVNYINAHTKIKIICPKHGMFEQTPNSHLSGDGCAKCYNEDRVISFSDFICKSNVIHNFKYNYSLVEYINCRSKIKIICPKHGMFEQTPNSHLSGRGCVKCNYSKNEIKIKEWLDINNIAYEKEKIFLNCKNILPLRFDFYLPEHNMLIEYDGEQHYNNIEYLGGKNKLNYIQQNDAIKTRYAKDNGIMLLRISYMEKNNILTILKSNIIKTP